ncbi:DUF1517 domain-containing protein [Geitlerinema sp. PCC 7407]|uniref:DUF1517 domain-containing protein n=1 Tax=Geitlerinema sp. PCC 7407 TaxID=1173025 RepID=UPI00029FEA2E|nr:DUF1517 domain-containing protein [Geitlerinema sp. PCC 7407]AFY68087.1 hypothetical protein GEI7407_3620 [Geitlerinema sp. PCC 7407]
MRKKLMATIKPFLKSLVMLGLVATLVLGSAGDAWAARTGGRMGGGSFRAPSSYSAPTRTYNPPSAYPGGGFGGGFGFPFFFPMPFFGIGGGFGGLFTILIVIAIANFLMRSFRNFSEGGETMGYSSNPSVSVAKLQVGLLAQARDLQADLDRVSRTANTSTSEGLTQVLQETSLALLRHPEYWVYGASESQQARLETAEAQFNRLSLAERSKFSEETLSNVNNQLRQAERRAALPVVERDGEIFVRADLNPEGPGEYIVVTLLVGTQGKLDLPTINGADDLRQALRKIGAVGSDQLLAVEVLWTPQADGDVLTTDDLLAEYPDLKLV